MAKAKKYIKLTLTWLMFLIIYLILLTLLNYIKIIKYSSIVKINLIITAITTFIFSILNGKTITKKGYKEGLKLGAAISAILLLLNLIFIREFSLSTFIYYLVIILSTTFGSILGINLKKK